MPARAYTREAAIRPAASGDRWRSVRELDSAMRRVIARATDEKLPTQVPVGGATAPAWLDRGGDPIRVCDGPSVRPLLLRAE